MEDSTSAIKSAFNYRGIAISDFASAIEINWGESPNIQVERISLKTATGQLTGSAVLNGMKPMLKAQLVGGSNLSELLPL